MKGLPKLIKPGVGDRVRPSVKYVNKKKEKQKGEKEKGTGGWEADSLTELGR